MVLPIILSVPLQVKPSELAAIMYFLTSDEALNINGVNVPVDQVHMDPWSLSANPLLSARHPLEQGQQCILDFTVSWQNDLQTHRLAMAELTSQLAMVSVMQFSVKETVGYRNGSDFGPIACSQGWAAGANRLT